MPADGTKYLSLIAWHRPYTNLRVRFVVIHPAIHESLLRSGIPKSRFQIVFVCERQIISSDTWRMNVYRNSRLRN